MSASMQSSNGPETGSLRHHSVPASPVCVRECVCECECECEASSGPRVPPTAAPSASASSLAVPPPPSPSSSSSRVRTRLQLCLLLASVGALTGLCSTAINISVFMLAVLQDGLARQGSYGLFLSFSMDVFFVVLAALLCRVLCPAAIGSGVTQMKYVLSGNALSAAPCYFSSTAWAVKVVGIVLVVAGRLNVGREGSLVQIAGCITHFLTKKAKLFKDVSVEANQQRQLYAAAASVGIATAFHAPVGGVLFSIEVTGTFYFVNNYWKAFVASVSGMLCVELLQSSVREGYVLPTMIVIKKSSCPTSVLSAYHSSELLIFSFIGVMGGVMGCGLLVLHTVYRAYTTSCRERKPLLFTFCTSIVTLVVLYYTDLYLRSFSFTNVGLFEYDFLKLQFLTVPHSGREHSIEQYFILASSQCFLTLIGTNSPVPTGTFFPMFVVGASLGFIVARTVRSLEGSSGGTQILNDSNPIDMSHLFAMAHNDPTGYAVIGGVALTASFTQAISCAVIAIEITGDINLLLPCLLVAVIASGMSKFYGLSVYERTMEKSKLDNLSIHLEYFLRDQQPVPSQSQLASPTASKDCVDIFDKVISKNTAGDSSDNVTGGSSAANGGRNEIFVSNVEAL